VGFSFGYHDRYMRRRSDQGEKTIISASRRFRKGTRPQLEICSSLIDID